jgi:ABC-type branched-subunit amino acid transport system substrate-binding protein
MTLATSLQKAAQNAIKSLGGEVTVQTVSGGTYDTATGQISESISSNQIKGVLQGVSAREVNELIQSGDKRLIIAAAVPTTQDRVLISSVSHEVIKIDTIEQDNEPITYELILRA